MEQRSIHEIDQTLGRSEGAVKLLQFRALTALRAQLEKSNG
jgi:DNA-directed RNA polymerase specialized sigma24 family protein